MLTIAAKRKIRQHANARANMPVDVIAGSDKPKVTGKSYYWTTPGGRPIHFPNAYKWPKIYHASTLSVEVGIGWLIENCPGGLTEEFANNAYGVKT